MNLQSEIFWRNPKEIYKKFTRKQPQVWIPDLIKFYSSKQQMSGQVENIIKKTVEQGKFLIIFYHHTEFLNNQFNVTEIITQRTKWGVG